MFNLGAYRGFLIRNKGDSASWTNIQVFGIVKNPIYKGYMYRRVACCTDNLTHKSVSIPEEKRKYVKGNFPHIVSEELWEKCRRRRVSCGPRKQGPAAQSYGNAGTAQGDKWACRLSCGRRAGMHRQFKTPSSICYECRRANPQTGAEKNQAGEGTAVKPSGATAGAGQGGMCSPGETPSLMKRQPGIFGRICPRSFCHALKKPVRPRSHH